MIRVTTWCRADLAGGTLDIWPIGLLHPGARTVNVALDLPVDVEFHPRSAGFRVVQGEATLEAATDSDLRAHPETALLGEIVRATGLTSGEIRIRSASPRGAGLGASSALTVALLAAVELARGGTLERSAGARAALARDLEARLMKLPTGMQDHFPGQLGGALEIVHDPGDERVRQLDVDLDALGERLLVAYSGQSHFSAGANWAIIRGRLDGDPELALRLDRIRDVASAMPAALCAGRWDEVGRLVSEEWSARRELSPAISTPLLEQLLCRGTELGGWGGKAGGAGGGGSVFLLAPPDAHPAILEAWRALGAEPLPARPTRRGLEFEI